METNQKKRFCNINELKQIWLVLVKMLIVWIMLGATRKYMHNQEELVSDKEDSSVEFGPLDFILIILRGRMGLYL